MPEVRIDELPVATTLTGSEVLPMMQGGLTKQADVGAINATSPYLINQSAPGGNIAARPSIADIPNGRVIWSIYDAPGTVNGPSDVQSNDIIFNLSGVAW